MRKLYARLLDRSKHVKIWISRAQFEASLDVDAARRTFVEADGYGVGLCMFLWLVVVGFFFQVRVSQKRSQHQRFRY